MQSAELERTTVDIAAKANGRVIDLRATGQVVKFDGFLTLYQEGHDEGEDDEESRRLPAMSEGETLKKEAINATQHFTEPPPRFSEAALVKRMEELGIGRPSTYASILGRAQGSRLHADRQEAARFPRTRDASSSRSWKASSRNMSSMTSPPSLEEQLDRVSNNELVWQDLLREFWDRLHRRRCRDQGSAHHEVLDALNDLLAPHIFPPRADGGEAAAMPRLQRGTDFAESRKVRRLYRLLTLSGMPLHAAIGRRREWRHRQFGAACSATIRRPGLKSRCATAGSGPTCSWAKAARKKSRNAPVLPKGLLPEDVDLEKALGLLSLPREVGKHPESGEMIYAGVGRFGSYVKHEKTYANLEAGDEVLNIGLNRAVTLIAEKKLKPGGGRRFGADPGRPLGEHPDKGGPVVAKNGRYGPYVSHDGVNATITGSKTHENVTLEEAVALIDARIEAGGGKKRKKVAKAKAPKEATRQRPRKSPPRRKPKAKAINQWRRGNRFRDHGVARRRSSQAARDPQEQGRELIYAG